MRDKQFLWVYVIRINGFAGKLDKKAMSNFCKSIGADIKYNSLFVHRSGWGGRLLTRDSVKGYSYNELDPDWAKELAEMFDAIPVKEQQN